MMFSRQESVRSDANMASSTKSGGTAKRVLSSIIETSGFVCGSLKDTVQDKLADNDMDMKWVEGEIDNIRSKIGPKMEKPREHILNLAEKACSRGGDGEQLSPVTTSMQHMPAGAMMASGVITGSFLDENTFDETTVATIEERGRTRTLSSNSMDDETASTLMTTDTPPKQRSRFEQIIEEDKMAVKAEAEAAAAQLALGGGSVVIGLCLSRKNSTLGHPDTVTRQTAFDFNELQDRDYKYVSSTDAGGWLAGGGERGDPYLSGVPSSEFDENESNSKKGIGSGHKVAAPDRVYIPIIEIDAASSIVIEEIVSALARGEIFIPEVSILLESLSVNNTSPPDLVVTFGCEKNDDSNPEDWPNWCLEFLHNQLYDYFANMGAQWSRRPFQITLARKVKWLTVKHMNKYFARSEQVINSWREKGPQYLKPPYSDDSSRGVILEEITRPHGIYLIQNGVPTNYFAPNFQPPYTTKMRRSLIRNVINKSWDSKHRDWRSEPVPRRSGPVQIISSVIGCGKDRCGNQSGALSPVNENTIVKSIGAFHLRSDFDLVADSRDTVDGGPKHSDIRNKKGDKKDNEIQQSETQHEQNKDPHRRREERERGEMKITRSVPSDESYGISTRPDPSLSLKETETDINDPITAARSTSNTSQWSIGQSPDKSSNDYSEKKHFFNGIDPSRTSSFASSKDMVSYSDSSFAESEKKYDSEQRPPMMNDKKSEKFARTKVCV